MLDNNSAAAASTNITASRTITATTAFTTARTQCRECNGSSFCVHDKRRTTCKQCDGASVCPHNKQRYQCKQCIEATKAGK